MRILQLVHQYPPQFVGGTELYTQSLAQGLSARGHEVGVFHRASAPGTGLAQREEGGAIVWDAWHGRVTALSRIVAAFHDPVLTAYVNTILDEWQPDVVHIQHLMGLPTTLIPLLRRRDIPFAITLHDYWWVCANAQLLTNYSQRICGGPCAYINCACCALARAGVPYGLPAVPALAVVLAERARRLRRGLRQATLLIAPSRFVMRWYTDHVAPGAEIRVVPHGLVSPPKGQLQRRGEGPLRCLYVGGLSWQKGVHVVIEAVSPLGNATLAIAGDEAADPQYSARLRSLAGPNTRFMGRLSRSAVWDALRAADLLVVPSLWYETFSIVVREAFAVGIPVLVSDLGALSEAVRDGIDGLCLPPGDVAAWRGAIDSLSTDPDRLAAMRGAVGPPVSMEEHLGTIEKLYAGCV